MKLLRVFASLFVASSALAAPTPNDKEVLVRGWKNEELRRILDDFKAMYRDRLSPDYGVVVHPLPEGAIRLTFPVDLPPPFFAWLVNYIRYPKDFDLSTRSILVLGRTTLSSVFEPPEKKMISQRAAFYVPADDHEYDLVFVRVGVATYELSFARGQWKLVSNSRLPPGLDALMKEEPNQPPEPTAPSGRGSS